MKPVGLLLLLSVIALLTGMAIPPAGATDAVGFDKAPGSPDPFVQDRRPRPPDDEEEFVELKPRKPHGEDEEEDGKDDERPPMRPRPGMGEGDEGRPPMKRRPGTEGGDRRMGPEEDDFPMTESKIEEVLGFLKENVPERLEELKRLKDENKGAFLQKIRAAYGEMKMLYNLKKENPEEYDRIMKERSLERTSWQIAEKLRSMKKGGKEGGTKTGGDTAELRKKLKNVLGELFELRETQRAREIEEIEKRLEELKGRMEKRRSGKDEIVERRLKEMMGERHEDEMEW